MELNMEPMEHELGLLGGNRYRDPIPYRSHCRYTSTWHKAPLRIFRMFLLLIILPSLFILIPLYMRYRVYSSQMYPMGVSDMRLIDTKISPTWCQRQVVKSNTTFNAFVVPGSPGISDELVPVTMTRTLELEDDMKEYWGFYLLKGSSVTVSACVRYPGASLIMIKGYKHLKECAYIGDDSSEEIDELLKANELGLLSNSSLKEKLLNFKREEGKTNNPDTMKRHKAGVSFHDPSHKKNETDSEVDHILATDFNEPDPKELKEILEQIHAIKEQAKEEKAKHYKPPPHLMALPGLHRHRDTNVDKVERKFLSFKELEIMKNNGSSHTSIINDLNNITEKVLTQTDTNDKNNLEDNSNKDNAINKKESFNSTLDAKNQSEDGETVLNTNHSTVDFQIQNNSKIDITNVIKNIESINDSLATNNRDNNKEQQKIFFKTNHTTVDLQTIKTFNNNKTIEKESGYLNEKITESNNVKKDIIEINEMVSKAEKTDADMEQDVKNIEKSSKEIYDEVLNKLEKLGEKGKRIIHKLHLKINGVKESIVSESGQININNLEVLEENIREEQTRIERNEKRKASLIEGIRRKRQMTLGDIVNEKELNQDDEARDFAAEEEEESDGAAEHHFRLSESSPLDMSNSEFWSSFSSSEEALLECEGLILNLPLTPNGICAPGTSDANRDRAAEKNALTYRVPANGYYFFVFNSENEVQTNYINVKFNLQKTKYDLARNTLRECKNSTERCDLLLDIFSGQKVVLELPLNDNQSQWNEQFIVISECEPRTSIYLACVIIVPLLIIIFGFQ